MAFRHSACSSGDGVLSELASRSCTEAERAWAKFQSVSASDLPAVLWDNALSGSLLCILASRAAGELDDCTCQKLLVAHVLVAHGKTEGSSFCRCFQSEAVALARSELHLWHASWQRAKRKASVDFNNAFGWHALPVTDPVWQTEDFRAKWLAIAHSGCRGCGDSLPVANGPLDASSELALAANRLLPTGYELIAVSGSGTEAIQSFYDIANAYLTRDSLAVTDAKLLFFRGCYVGGAHGLQGANGIDFIARQAFAPSHVEDECLLDGAPYCVEALEELEALLESQCMHQPAKGSGVKDYPPIDAASVETSNLLPKESACLRGIAARIERMQGVGKHVGGVVVEVVSSHGALGLRPAFLAELRSLLSARGLLLFEDAVMSGLRCGAPFLGHVCPAVKPDFVAIGKAWGFSGVIGHCDAMSTATWPHRPPPYLNGYLTMRMSAADLLRAITILGAVHERALISNALRSGRLLRSTLQAQGLDIWGLGLLLGFDDGSDAPEGQHPAVLLNASAAFSRLLPPLTFGTCETDWVYVSSLVVGGDESAKRVAERVLCLQMQARHHSNAPTPIKTVDCQDAVEQALTTGDLMPFATILSPMLRARLKAKSEALDLTPSPHDCEDDEDARKASLRLERISDLWADVMGMP
jgi:4-aminobutyrate aminotransferase-like enzyme